MAAKKWLMLLLGYLFFSAPASATIVSPVADRDLIEQAVAIVVAEVTAIESHWDPHESQVFTHITLSIQEVLKGELPAGELTIKQVGGTVGDLHAWTYGSVEFERGEKALLFLQVNPDGTLRVAQLYQGKFSIFMDEYTGEEFALREVPTGVDIVSSFDSVEDSQDFHEFEDLKARIRAFMEDDPAPHRSQAPLSLGLPAPVANGMSESHDQFTFLGKPSRWFEPDTGTPVTMLMNINGEPAAPGDGFDQIRAGYNAWSTVDESNFAYDDGGFTQAAGFRFDGVNAISFRDPLGQIDPPSNCRGILAIGGYYRSGSQTRTVNGQSFFRILEGDIVFNDGWEDCGVFYQNFKNLAEVGAHELGHVLGLGHSADRDATMYAFAHFDGRGASLRADDSAGLAFVYPAATPNGPPLIVGAPGALAKGKVGVAYNAPLGISGGNPPYTVAVVKGSLPPGLDLNSVEITGTPTKAGKNRFTLEVTDQDRFSASKKFELRIFKGKKVAKALSIATGNLKSGRAGKKYGTTVKARGGRRPYAWSIISGTLPEGLELNNNGKIVGRPTVSGSFPVSLEVTDGLGSVVQKNLTLMIKD